MRYTHWNLNARKAFATLERKESDALYAHWNLNVRKAFAALERRGSDTRYIHWNINVHKAFAPTERISPDARDARRYLHAFKVFAISKRPCLDFSNAFRNHDALDFVSAFFFNACYDSAFDFQVFRYIFHNHSCLGDVAVCAMDDEFA